ncbi:prolyl oligopeptidase family serine peptidase [Sphingomonas sp. HITSZ_GF]|uniref:S9 family peptidase n=1 Tax=Sphingomonas sp. HITSZ_GF TaxID=3037247 RepID=UPI00240DFC49|nr:prolyl oligopeptidase family serine peptidase [Sphingomonas sp. HITSZ_GF]MDG2534263.1 prolyl oligopeptidase family serine peptidase [Sphingomonas sp. HITSZ_GF]
MRAGRRWLAALAGFLAFAFPPATAQPRHPLTLDDVLDVQRIDQAVLSPDGNWIAAIVQRPARAGEVYGRLPYETDPTRSDLWLIDTRTGARRAITNGAAQAAGYWCASWSPDNRHLALLSTQPARGEPHGGDNVRLHVWDRATGAMTRMGDTPVMSQTRYGGALDKLDLRGGAIKRARAHACQLEEDNAPFLWLDAHRLLVATLPPGQVSGVLDQYGRPYAEAARTAARLRAGTEPTVMAMGSGAARLPRDDASHAILRIVDVTTRRAQTIGTVPTYPFRSALTLSVSPDGKRLAVMATLGALQPEAGKTLPNNTDDNWTVERRLGFLDLAPNSAVRWVMASPRARHPVQMLDWTEDGGIAYTARSSPFEEKALRFIASPNGGAYAPEGPAPAPVERNIAMPPHGTLLDDRPDLDTVLWSETSRAGLVLHLSRASTNTTRDLLVLDTHLAAVDWGETRLIDYASTRGEPLKAAAILPPGYRAGQRYPVLVWVYGGYMVRDLDHDFMTDVFMPGIYNLHLYAARGYVVLVPSMPLGNRREDANSYTRIGDGVMPAIDRLAALGIADPDRVGVFGQSFGGYSVLALLTQSDRFKAGVAMAGLSDIASLYGEMDPGAAGYPGIAHEKSDNWAELDTTGRTAPPWQDPAGYAAVSPLSHVDRVTTPLLLVHGDLDMRGAPSQAERFFYALYAQGKTAKLLRYGGESHSLTQSPANIRSIFAETNAWFDAYVRLRQSRP